MFRLVIHIPQRLAHAVPARTPGAPLSMLYADSALATGSCTHACQVREVLGGEASKGAPCMCGMHPRGRPQLQRTSVSIPRGYSLDTADLKQTEDACMCAQMSVCCGTALNRNARPAAPALAPHQLLQRGVLLAFAGRPGKRPNGSFGCSQHVSPTGLPQRLQLPHGRNGLCTGACVPPLCTPPIYPPYIPASPPPQPVYRRLLQRRAGVPSARDPQPAP